MLKKTLEEKFGVHLPGVYRLHGNQDDIIGMDVMVSGDIRLDLVDGIHCHPDEI